MNKSLDVSGMASQLEDGEMFRGVCPFCRGGQSGENSFSVRRSGNVAFYKCYRASCDEGGTYTYITGATHRAYKPGGAPVDNQAMRYKEAIISIKPDQAAFLCKKYGLARKMLDMYTLGSAKDGRIVIPIRDKGGRIVGEELKHYPELNPKNTFAKSLVMINKDAPLLSWYKGSYIYSDYDALAGENVLSNTLLVVEDQISAMKASPFCHTVALLGCHLTSQKILELSDVRYKSVIFAFDADAFSNAIKSYRKAHALISGLQVVRLTKDIKDMDYKDIKKIIINEHTE